MNEAWSAVASGQYRLAALSSAEAIERASDNGDVDALTTANYWAAEVAVSLGDYPKALQFIIDGERTDASVGLFAMRRRELRFAILSNWRPYRRDLIRNLDEIRDLARRFAAPAENINYLSATLYSAIGDWAAALREASLGPVDG